MTDDLTGVTPPTGPGGVAAYGLAGMAGPGRDAWPPPERGRQQRPSPLDSPSYPPRSAGPRPEYPGPPAYADPPVHHRHEQAPGRPAATPRGSRARRPGPLRGAQIPYAIVLVGLAAGLAYIWQGPHSVRAGTFILAGALFVAVAARLALPERRAGMLASRRRYIDVTVLAILAIGLLVAGLVLPTPS